MIRILHVVRSMDIGGIETFIMNIYRNIDRSKIQFDFLVSVKNNCAYDEEINQFGGNIYYIHPRNKGFIKNRDALKKFFKEKGQNYVGIHQHSSSLTSILPLIYAKKYKIKTRIIHSHSTSLKSSNKLHLLLHALNKLRLGFYANHFFACSDLAAKWFYIHKNNVEIIKNGIDTSRFKYDIDIRNKIRNMYSVNDKMVFGHIGSFIKVKNQRYVIDIFQSFQKLNSDSVLWLVGDGPLLSEVMNYAGKMGIIDKVTFFKIRKDTNELLQGMDIFLFPSLFEGLPLALVEAQTTGISVFASKNISNQAMLTKNIRLLDIRLDAKVWAQEIYENFPYERLNCSKEIISKGYDIQNTIQYLTEIYLCNYEQ